MTKKIILLSLALFVFITNSKSQNSILDRSAEKLADQTVTSIKKNNIPAKTKFVAMNFYFGYSNNDTIKSELGVVFAQKYSHYLQLAFDSKKLDYEVLSINEQAQDAMKGAFSKPEGVKSENFWEEFVEENTPDYYIVGKCIMDENYQNFKVSEVKLLADDYNFEIKSIAVPEISMSINKSDKQELLKYETVENVEDLARKITHYSDLKVNLWSVRRINVIFAA